MAHPPASAAVSCPTATRHSANAPRTGPSVVTSGAPSPTLGTPIAMAYVERDAGGPFGIDIRGKTEPAEVTGLPFYDRRK